MEKGEAKHILAPTATANIKAWGCKPNDKAVLIAMGAKSTAVAVLLMNIVISEVVKYTPAKSIYGLLSPKLPTNAFDTKADTPVFSKANAIGSIPAMSTILSLISSFNIAQSS